MSKFSFFGFCWLILFYGSNLCAQGPQLERLSNAEGLSQGMIYDLLQDRQGFMWFATKGGLNRYDGYSIKAFQNNPFDPFSISDNEIKVLLEDHLGRIWAGTATNGLSVLDQKSGRFFSFSKFPNPNIKCLAQTTDGSIWVGTDTGIYRLRVPDLLPTQKPYLDEIVPIEHTPLEGILPFPNQIPQDLKGSKDGRLWISTTNGIEVLDPGTGQLQVVWTSSAFTPNTPLQSLFRESADGAVWAGQAGQILRMRGTRVEVFKLPETSIFPYTDLAFDVLGNAFISTRKQIFRLSNALQATPEQANFELFYRFPEAGIIGSTRLWIDRGGLLWIGTNGYGLRKYNPGNPAFHHYIAGKSPRRIVSDSKENIWAWQAGIFYRLDKIKNQLDAPILFDPHLFQHDLLQAQTGSLWLLCEIKFPTQFNALLLKLNPFTLKEEARFSLPIQAGMFSRLYEGEAGKLWILGSESVLCQFDSKTAQSSIIDFSSVTGFREFALGMDIDEAGILWIGTPHGLVKAFPKPEKTGYELYKNNPKNPESMNCNSVLCLQKDPITPELLWLGTNGGGLSCLNKTTGKFIHYTPSEGLPNNVVYAILPDASGALWLSTNNGLSKFSTQSKAFHNYFGADGLQDNEFNTISYTSTSDGCLLFGGVNGITAFYPKELDASSAVAPSIWITRLSINSQPIGKELLENSIEQTHSITLDHTQNQLTFEFAAMDFSAPRMNQFKYRMRGLNEKWMEPSITNSATYAHLRPGKYVFEVITGGSRGIWNSPAAWLEIEILPPWYQSYWAYALYTLLSGLGIWGFYRFQTNRLRLENKLAFEQKEAQRLSELDGLKTNFVSSITHEFRTPLTLMLEPARQLLNEVKEKTSRYRLELIENNAQRLLNLVNQLLDLSKLEAGQMPLDLRLGNPATTVRMAAEQFQSLARQRDISWIVSIPETPVQVVFDENKLDKVISNLVSNALKFTDQGGAVNIKLTEKTSFDPFRKEFLLEVTDSGIGIASEDLPKVFDRFYQTAHTRGGTGIGLSLCKELVNQMGGSISVESPVENGKGSRFLVAFPAALALEDSLSPTLMVDRPELSGPLLYSLESPPQPPDQQPLLLLIEDDTELRHFLRASLPRHYRIAEAADGEEGLQMALELVPDLVISDLVMPKKDGFGVAEGLKRNPGTSHIPLILLTAKSAIDSKILGLRHGADVYLTKPFRADELSAHIENLLRSRKQLQAQFSTSAQAKSVLESAKAILPLEENEFLQRLIQVVEEHLDNESMDADGFARAMFISRSQLHRKISALTGLSLTEFVRNHRLDRARHMLSQREGSISEIAWRTGFPNARYFSTCFKERFGKTPSGFLAEGNA